MKEIVSRLTENRQIELAKEILESSGYKVSKKSRKLKESNDGDTMTYYLLSIDGATNAPGSKYSDPKRHEVGEEILQSAGISDSNVEVTQVGYDDISFIVASDDEQYVNKIARAIAAYAEEFSDEFIDEYDTSATGKVVQVSGPYSNKDFDYEEGTDTWYI